MIDEGQNLHASHRGTSAGVHLGAVQVLAPTVLEYLAAWWMLAGVDVVYAGVGLSRWRVRPGVEALIVCGLAGALRTGLPPGTIAIPDQVGRPDGRIIHCDALLTSALRQAARTLQFQIETGPLLTSSALITGSERQRWAQHGFATVDMEMGLLAGRYPRVATVRAVLDTPGRGISEEWLRPGKAMLRPALWGEFLWLTRTAPLYATRAARVLQVALQFPGARGDE